MNERYLFMTYTQRRNPRGQQSRGGRSFGGNRSKRKAAYINPALFVNKTQKTQETEVYQSEHKFSDFAMNDVLKRNMESAGFEQPSAIQDKAIPFALDGRDVIGLANTGTGKTAAFLLPVLDKLYKSRQTGSVLIMAPTRELAQQIEVEFRKFSNDMKLYAAVCVGGVNIGPQIRALKRRPHIVIGTPGRLKDLLNQGILQLDAVDTLILDEADRMLDMGFVADIREIAEHVPRNRQTLCFSATMSDGVKKIVHDFMNNPELVSVKVRETSDHIYQDVISYNDDDHRRELLVEMLTQSEFEKVIVFGETKFGVQRLSDKLLREGIASEAIHGNKSQGQRNRALSAFKTNRANVLVATDVAARGLDIDDVSHVINYDLPQSYDDYVHRIGRTGRGGKSGIALTFVNKR